MPAPYLLTCLSRRAFGLRFGATGLSQPIAELWHVLYASATPVYVPAMR